MEGWGVVEVQLPEGFESCLLWVYSDPRGGGDSVWQSCASRQPSVTHESTGVHPSPLSKYFRMKLTWCKSGHLLHHWQMGHFEGHNEKLPV